MRDLIKIILLLFFLVSFVVVDAYDLLDKILLNKDIDELSKNNKNSSACTFCHVIKNYNYKHIPYQKGDCLSCHDKTKKKVTNNNFVCFNCHFPRKNDKENFHTPYKKGFCLDCHDPHGGNKKAFVKIETNKLCLSCHFFKINLNKNWLHRPVKLKDCLSCHNPHQGYDGKNLILPVKDLCGSCHFTGILTGFYQHLPVSQKECLKCHEVHSSDQEKLLKNSYSALCASCHFYQYKENNHKTTSPKYCVNCHLQIHGGSYKLLPSPDVCLFCHKDKIIFYNKSRHNSRKCIDCHSPHNSLGKPLLIKENSISLCLSCHDIPTKSQGDFDRYGHPVGENYINPITSNEYMQCISCHNPHGTQFYKMILKPKDALCLSCHPK